MSLQLSKPMATRRAPRDIYNGRNGFIDWPGDPTHRQHPTADLPESEKMRRHKLAQYVLSEKGSFVPSLQSMKETRSPMENITSVTERIAELKKTHLRDLNRMYALQGEQYKQDAIDRYSSIDSDLFPAPEENDVDVLEAHAALMDLHNRDCQSRTHELDWDDAIEQLRYAHIQTLLPLWKRKADLTKTRNEHFPQSIAEYKRCDRDIRLRVARFLTLDSRAQQDRMLSEFNWVWRQVNVLCEEYQKNEEFKAEINDIVTKESHPLAKPGTLSTTDPRRRPFY